MKRLLTIKKHIKTKIKPQLSRETKGVLLKESITICQSTYDRLAIERSSSLEVALSLILSIALNFRFLAFSLSSLSFFFTVFNLSRYLKSQYNIFLLRSLRRAFCFRNRIIFTMASYYLAMAEAAA